MPKTEWKVLHFFKRFSVQSFKSELTDWRTCGYIGSNIGKQLVYLKRKVFGSSNSKSKDNFWIVVQPNVSQSESNF